MQSYFNTTIAKDLLDLIVGDLIGEGAFRTVYVYKPNPDYVVKFETGAQCFQNVIEHYTWGQVEETEFAKWFAPVHLISSCGTVLLMRRTEPLQKSQLPGKMPGFFTDMKRTNFGMLNGQVVCHDYGANLLMSNGLKKKMVKARWWDPTMPTARNST